MNTSISEPGSSNFPGLSSEESKTISNDWESNERNVRERYCGDFQEYLAVQTANILALKNWGDSDGDNLSAGAEGIPSKENSDTQEKRLALDILSTWNNDSKLRAEFNGNLEGYTSYRKAVAAGKVRVHSGNVSKLKQ